MSFKDRLKALRKKRGLTQQQLAYLLDVSQNAIYNWENGKRQPKIEMIEKISSILKAPKTDLLDWDEIPEIHDMVYASELISFKDSLKKDCYKLNEDERKSFTEKIDNYISSGKNIENLSEREVYYANATLVIGCELLKHLLDLSYVNDISITVDLVADFLTLNDNLKNIVWELVESLCGKGYAAQVDINADL